MPASVSAAEFATRIAPSERVDWSLLEAAAFRGSMRIFASVPAARVRPPASPREWLALVGLAPFAVVAVVAPGVGLSLVGIKNRLDVPEQIPGAALSFSIAMVAMLVGTLVCARRCRPPGLLLFTYSQMVAILGAATAYGVGFWGPSERPDDWAFWIMPVVGSVLIGLLFLLGCAMRIVRMASVTVDQAGLLPHVSLPVRRDQVSRLPEWRREEITSDIQRAIADLGERGVISRADEWSARNAALGTLAMQMG